MALKREKERERERKREKEREKERDVTLSESGGRILFQETPFKFLSRNNLSQIFLIAFTHGHILILVKSVTIN
jgi:hypothetical protein